MKSRCISKKVALSLYLFVLIFQPQIIPVSTIYVMGFATIVLSVLENQGKLRLDIVAKSGMLTLYKVFIGLAIYVVSISGIDLLSGGMLLLDNRLRCINQLLVLTGIEFLCLSFFFRQCDKYGFGFSDILCILALAGALQGLCSLAAFFVPQIRVFFLRYSGDVFRNAYVLERRGYGFSNILLDTYGYGMGLIAGVLLLSKTVNKFIKWPTIFLCLVAIILNARTGIIVFGVSAILYLFQANTRKRVFEKGFFAIILIFVVWKYVLPLVIAELMSSSSINIRWVGQGLNELFNILNRSTSLNDAAVLSSFSHMPDSILSIIIGSGHNIYGISKIIGFHSDVGYLNYLWEFGIVGMIAMIIALIRAYKNAYVTTDNRGKFVVAFLLISYVIVLFKAILIGYNPGVVVNYLLCFSIPYYHARYDK